MTRRSIAKRPAEAELRPELCSWRRSCPVFGLRRPHMESVSDSKHRPEQRLWQRFVPRPIWGRNYQARHGCNLRGLTPEQVATLRGQRLTLDQRRQMGLD